jgi:hypothetical protein
MYPLPKKQGAYVRTQNWQVSSDRPDLWAHRSDRCGQCPQNIIWISPIDRSRQVDQNPYVERPNRSTDEGDMTSPRSTRRAHRSDRCPSPVRPVPPRFRAKLRSPDRLGL